MKVLNVPVTKLERLVEETDANEVNVLDQSGTSFDVGSPVYEQRKDWAVIGQHELYVVGGRRVLTVPKLKREVEWSINPVKVVDAADAPEHDALADINRKVSVMVFHKRHLKWAATDTKRSSVFAYEKAAILNFRRTLPDAQPNDFGAIVIDWENRHVDLEQVPPDLFA